MLLNPEAQIQSQEGYNIGMPKQLARNRAKRKVKNSTVEVAGGLEYPESRIILFLGWKDEDTASEANLATAKRRIWVVGIREAAVYHVLTFLRGCVLCEPDSPDPTLALRESLPSQWAFLAIRPPLNLVAQICNPSYWEG